MKNIKLLLKRTSSLKKQSAKNMKEARKLTKEVYKGQNIKIISCYEMVSVQIEDIAKTDFSRACLSELKREGVKIGDIIHGTLNRKNWAVDFVSKETGTDCMAWLGILVDFYSILINKFIVIFKKYC